MADEGKNKTSGDGTGKAVATGVAVVAVVGLLTLGGVKLVDYFNTAEKRKQAEIDDYMAELQQLAALQQTIANSGVAPSAQETNQLNTLVAQIQFKETHWFKSNEIVQTIDAANEILKELGIAVLSTAGLVAGAVVAAFLYKLWKKRPPKTPTYRDPKSGQSFSSPEELAAYMEAAYQAENSAEILNEAQAEFETMPLWYQAEVAAISSSPAITAAGMSWGALGSSVNWVYVAVAMAAAAATAGLASPAAASLLLVAA